MPTTITLTGWKEFETKLQNMPKILEQEIDGELEAAAKDWAGMAKDAVVAQSYDTGGLAGGIIHEKIKTGEWQVTSKANYSAYVEWGTKTRVQVPAELSAYAISFKGGGGQGDLKKFIFAWCGRKGIAPNLWWPIFISIARFGVHAHPFFFIQMPIIEKELFENVKRILTTEH
jgi:hypothetical protein